MGAARCTSCHGRLPAGAWHCPGCGAAAGPLVLETPAQTAGDELDDPRAGRRPRGAMAGVAVTAVLLGAAAVVAGHPGGTTPRPAPTPTTVAPPADRSDGPLVLGQPKSLFAGFSPFPGATYDVEVLGLTAGGTLVRFDLDNGGGLRRVALQPARRPPTTLIARHGAVVVVTATGAGWAVPDDPEAAPVAIGDDGHRYLAATDAGQVWRLPRFDGAGGTADLVEVATGRLVASNPLPPHAVPLTDDARHGLLVSVDGVVYRLDGTSGALARVAPGPVLGVSKRLLVEAACRGQASCRVRVVDRTTGEPRPGGPLVDGPTMHATGTLSPAADQVAFAPAGGAGAIVVLAVDSGAVTTLPSPAGAEPVWTPDGRTLLWLDGDGRLSAWSGGEVRVDRRSRLPDLVALAVAPKPAPHGALTGP